MGGNSWAQSPKERKMDSNGMSDLKGIGFCYAMSRREGKKLTALFFSLQWPCREVMADQSLLGKLFRFGKPCSVVVLYRLFGAGEWPFRSGRRTGPIGRPPHLHTEPPGRIPWGFLRDRPRRHCPY